MGVGDWPDLYHMTSQGHSRPPSPMPGDGAQVPEKTWELCEKGLPTRRAYPLCFHVRCHLHMSQSPE